MHRSGVLQARRILLFDFMRPLHAPARRLRDMHNAESMGGKTSFRPHSMCCLECKCNGGCVRKMCGSWLRLLYFQTDCVPGVGRTNGKVLTSKFSRGLICFRTYWYRLVLVKNRLAAFRAIVDASGPGCMIWTSIRCCGKITHPRTCS